MEETKSEQISTQHLENPMEVLCLAKHLTQGESPTQEDFSGRTYSGTCLLLRTAAHGKKPHVPTSRKCTRGRNGTDNPPLFPIFHELLVEEVEKSGMKLGLGSREESV